MKETMFSIFPNEEYMQRYEKARGFMEESDVDALIVSDAENFEYFTGIRRTAFMKYMESIAVLPLDGEPIIAGHRYITGLHKITSWIEKARLWGGDYEIWHGEPGWERDSKDLFTKTLTDLGLADKVIGVESGRGMLMDMPFEVFEAMKTSLPNAKFVNATDLFWKVRKVKSPREQKVIRKLTDIACKGFNAVRESIRVGMTERDMARTMQEIWMHEGAHDSRMKGFLHIRSGPIRYGIGWARPSDRKLRKGEQFFIDGGPVYNGYLTDFMRLGYIGEPPSKTKHEFEAALKANIAGMEACRPGVKCCDLHEVIVTALKKEKVLGRIPGFCGHGLGLDLYETPWITATDTTVVEEGMYMAFETPLYDVPSFKDYQIWGSTEDNGLVTKKGFENLTGKVEQELWVIR